MQEHNLENILLQSNWHNLPQNTIQNIVEKYPYCAIANIINAKNNNTLKNIQLAGLYKGNPYLFAINLKTHTNISINTVPEIIEPIPTTDYFAQQNITVTNTEVEEFVNTNKKNKDLLAATTHSNIETIAEDQQLIITRSFNDWLLYFKQKKEKDAQEAKSKNALTAMWQREKLSAAAGEENEMVPEAVFKQAISSISPQENLASEALAEILINQGKYDKAKEMYQKLSLKYPEKSTYFASKIKNSINLNI